MLCSDPAAVQAKHISTSAAGADGDRNVLSEADLRSKLSSKNVGAQQADSAVKTMRTLETPCSVCMDVLDTPACSAVCGHVFCYECISSVINTTGSSGPCPLCRIPVKVADLLQLLPEEAADGATKVKSETEKLLEATQSTMGTKLRALLGALREMEKSDPGAKAVVFTSFQATHQKRK